jgi:hypothetical protein
LKPLLHGFGCEWHVFDCTFATTHRPPELARASRSGNDHWVGRVAPSVDLAEFRALLGTEQDLIERLRQTRAQLAEAVDRGVRQGVSYDRLAIEAEPPLEKGHRFGSASSRRSR